MTSIENNRNFYNLPQNLTYLHSLLDPFNVVSGIPDLNQTSSILKDVSITQNIEVGVSGSGLLWFTPGSPDGVLKLFVWNEILQLFIFHSVITPDEAIEDSFTFARFVSGGMHVVSATISGSNFNVSGTMNATQFQQAPEYAQLNYQNVVSFSRNNVSKLLSIPVATGITTLAFPDGEYEFQPRETNGVHVKAPPIEMVRDLTVVGDQIFEFNGTNAPSNITGWTDVYFHYSTLALLADGTVGFVFEVHEVRADPTNWNALIDVPTNYSFTVAHNAGFGGEGELHFRHYTSGFVTSIELAVGGNGLDFAGTNTWRIVNESYYAPGYLGPGTMIAFQGIEEGNQLSLAAKLNYEAVPDSDLSRQLSTSRGKYENVLDLKLAEYMIANSEENGLKFLWTIPEYRMAVTSGVIQNVTSTSHVIKTAGFVDFIRGMAPLITPLINTISRSFGGPEIIPQGNMYTSSTYRNENNKYGQMTSTYRNYKTGQPMLMSSEGSTPIPETRSKPSIRDEYIFYRDYHPPGKKNCKSFTVNSDLQLVEESGRVHDFLNTSKPVVKNVISMSDNMKKNVIWSTDDHKKEKDEITKKMLKKMEQKHYDSEEMPIDMTLGEQEDEKKEDQNLVNNDENFIRRDLNLGSFPSNRRTPTTISSTYMAPPKRTWGKSSNKVYGGSWRKQNKPGQYLRKFRIKEDNNKKENKIVGSTIELKSTSDPSFKEEIVNFRFNTADFVKPDDVEFSGLLLEDVQSYSGEWWKVPYVNELMHNRISRGQFHVPYLMVKNLAAGVFDNVASPVVVTITPQPLKGVDYKVLEWSTPMEGSLCFASSANLSAEILYQLAVSSMNGNLGHEYFHITAPSNMEGMSGASIGLAIGACALKCPMKAILSGAIDWQGNILAVSDLEAKFLLAKRMKLPFITPSDESNLEFRNKYRARPGVAEFSLMSGYCLVAETVPGIFCPSYLVQLPLLTLQIYSMGEPESRVRYLQAKEVSEPKQGTVVRYVPESVEEYIVGVDKPAKYTLEQVSDEEWWDTWFPKAQKENMFIGMDIERIYNYLDDQKYDKLAGIMDQIYNKFKLKEGSTGNATKGVSKSGKTTLTLQEIKDTDWTTIRRALSSQMTEDQVTGYIRARTDKSLQKLANLYEQYLQYKGSKSRTKRVKTRLMPTRVVTKGGREGAARPVRKTGQKTLRRLMAPKEVVEEKIEIKSEPPKVVVQQEMREVEEEVETDEDIGYEHGGLSEEEEVVTPPPKKVYQRKYAKAPRSNF